MDRMLASVSDRLLRTLSIERIAFFLAETTSDSGFICIRLRNSRSSCREHRSQSL